MELHNVLGPSVPFQTKRVTLEKAYVHVHDVIRKPQEPQ